MSNFWGAVQFETDVFILSRIIPSKDIKKVFHSQRLVTMNLLNLLLKG